MAWKIAQFYGPMMIRTIEVWPVSKNYHNSFFLNGWIIFYKVENYSRKRKNKILGYINLTK